MYSTFSAVLLIRKVQIAAGLHERCAYFCFGVNNYSEISQLTPTAEKQFYSSLYDDLLSSVGTFNRIKFSLAEVFFIVKLFSYRIFIWSKEAFSFLQPRVNELKMNQPCKLMNETTIFRTQQQMAIRRRSAEHIVRYSCLIQIFQNSLRVLKSMNQNLIKESGESIDETFETEAKQQVNDL